MAPPSLVQWVPTCLFRLSSFYSVKSQPLVQGKWLPSLSEFVFIFKRRLTTPLNNLWKSMNLLHSVNSNSLQGYFGAVGCLDKLVDVTEMRRRLRHAEKCRVDVNIGQASSDDRNTDSAVQQSWCVLFGLVGFWSSHFNERTLVLLSQILNAFQFIPWILKTCDLHNSGHIGSTKSYVPRPSCVRWLFSNESTANALDVPPPVWFCCSGDGSQTILPVGPFHWCSRIPSAAPQLSYTPLSSMEL